MNASTRWLVTVLAGVLLGSACSGGTPPPPTIGLITNNSNGLRNVAGFIDGLADLGYVEGDTVEYLFAGEPTPNDQLEAAINEMLEAGVDLIFTAGTPTGVAAHRVTTATGVPVVFGVIADPVEAGVLENLEAPGGNMTGVRLSKDQSKRLEILLELDPSIVRVMVPFNPADSAATTAVDQISAIAAGLGVELVLEPSATDEDMLRLLGEPAADIDAVFLVPDSLVNAHLAGIVEFATANGIPTSGPSTAQVENGALMAYGFIHHAAGYQAARIADQILDGADPALLPVQDTESFLAINLASAADIGLQIPDVLLERAAIVIRPGGEQG